MTVGFTSVERPGSAAGAWRFTAGRRVSRLPLSPRQDEPQEDEETCREGGRGRDNAGDEPTGEPARRTVSMFGAPTLQGVEDAEEVEARRAQVAEGEEDKAPGDAQQGADSQ